jgi:hypothetical protein
LFQSEIDALLITVYASHDPRYHHYVSKYRYSSTAQVQCIEVHFNIRGDGSESPRRSAFSRAWNDTSSTSIPTVIVGHIGPRRSGYDAH